MTSFTLPSRPVLAEWMDAGTSRFERDVQARDDYGLGAPSALAGWSGKHVVAHVARNADALVNLLTWARTGSETPMYPDPDSRQSDIDRTAQQPAAELVSDLLSSGARLRQAVVELPESAWGEIVRTAQGRMVPASTVLWMRVREVWVHAIDLPGASTRFSDLPGPLLEALITDAIATVVGRGGAPRLTLIAEGGGPSWEVAGDGAATEVRGPLASIAAYVLRGDTAGVETAAASTAVPAAPRWL